MSATLPARLSGPKMIFNANTMNDQIAAQNTIVTMKLRSFNRVKLRHFVVQDIGHFPRQLDE